MERYGGRRVYVPARVSPGCALSVALGETTAQALAAVAKGTQLSIPRGVPEERRVRDASLRADRAEKGHSVPELAMTYQLTERQVYNILNKAPRGSQS